MADYVISPPAITSVPVKGGGNFPIRRVFCVGRNYAEHAREMGSDPDREPPFFFMKPADALLLNDGDMPYPPQSTQLHHEMELVVALGEGGSNIAEADALAHVWGYAAGLDMTRRDLQNAAKKEGKPWDMGKGFDWSAPIGLMVPASKIGHPSTGLIELKVNGKVRQTSDLSKMIWNVSETIAYLSGLVKLAPGDLIYTGTPENVAAVQRGDLLEGVVEGVGSVRTRIT
ncbi:MAG: fumarylpyruvate hydrolase [Acetobacteraceae bacterium]|jgi:fumarylpyruvate hydrolase|nr:fumarylacetoacetate hydrolase family protein [Rhodopila sp.]MEA2728343.1 fumarylpyruvate hydrolase [Acetobacteraceae bacterium]